MSFDFDFCAPSVHTHICIYMKVYIFMDVPCLSNHYLARAGNTRQPLYWRTTRTRVRRKERKEKERTDSGTNGLWCKGEKRRQGVFHCNRWIPDNVQSEMRGKCAVQAIATPTLKHWWHHGNTIETRNCQPSLSFTMTPFSLCVCVCV